MSQTIETEVETTPTYDENVPASPSYRSPLSEEEYQRQKREYTKQELKKAQLFYQHTFHFCVLSVVDKLRPLWNRKALCAGSLLAVLVLGFLLLSSGPSKQTSEGGGLVPTMTFAQRVTNLPYEFLERISRLAGRSKKELLLPEDSLFSSSSSFFANKNESEAQHEEVKSKAAAAERKKSSAAEAANKQASPAEDASKKAALVDAQEPSFSSFLASDTYKGMDIFTFAFCVARDFATSIFSSTFGWSNGTTQAA